MRRRITAVLSGAAVALTALAVPATAQADPAPLNWVHMGNSFASGTGAGQYQAGTDASGNRCWRSNNSYAEQLKAQLQAAGRQVNLTNVACSGATVSSFYGMFKGQAPQLNALTVGTKLVTLDIGGNDAGFGEYSGKCLSTGDNAVDCSGQPTFDVLGRLPQVGKDVSKLLKDIKSRSPQARVVLVAYGRIVTPGANAPNVQLDPICGPDFLNPNERVAANLVSSLLDFTLRSAVTDARLSGVNAAFASPYAPSLTDPFNVVPAFQNHSLCESGAPYYNGFVGISTDPAGLEGLLHPNPAGQGAFIPLVKQAAGL